VGEKERGLIFAWPLRIDLGSAPDLRLTAQTGLTSVGNGGTAMAAQNPEKSCPATLGSRSSNVIGGNLGRGLLDRTGATYA